MMKPKYYNNLNIFVVFLKLMLYNKQKGVKLIEKNTCKIIEL